MSEVQKQSTDPNAANYEPPANEQSKNAAKKAKKKVIDAAAEAALERYEALKKKAAESAHNNIIVNPGMEDGTGGTIAENYKFDESNIYARPSLDHFDRNPWQPESNSVANASQLMKIEEHLVGIGIPKERLAPNMWAFAMYCASASSSNKMDPVGTEGEFAGFVKRDSIAAICREHSTVRQVCRAYAPVVWAYMLKNNCPPSDWQAKGFKYEDRFAAFDFFDYVENPACVRPIEGHFRAPTESERVAHATHKALALDRAAKDSRFANFDAEITGGKHGCKVNRKWRESNCG